MSSDIAILTYASRNPIPERISITWSAWKVRYHLLSSYSFMNKFDSGKTSLIHSLAGELGLDIYVVSLSSKGYEFPSLSLLGPAYSFILE